MPAIGVVPFYLGDQRELLAGLAAGLARAFGAEVQTRAPWFDPEAAFDPVRGQYSSTRLLGWLLEDPQRRAAAPADRLLAVTGVDLFIPVLTYVFGEAQVDGRAAVVSVHRLRNEVYGLPPDPALLASRLEKEAVHELGHTYGLVHCREVSCVMRASTYAEDIDLKPAWFCPRCRAALPPAIAAAPWGVCR